MKCVTDAKGGLAPPPDRLTLFHKETVLTWTVEQMSFHLPTTVRIVQCTKAAIEALGLARMFMFVVHRNAHITIRGARVSDIAMGFLAPNSGDLVLGPRILDVTDALLTNIIAHELMQILGMRHGGPYDFVSYETPVDRALVDLCYGAEEDKPFIDRVHPVVTRLLF